jgi:XRE family transcriptional regulator, regulator of sulfur utilization
MGSPLSKDEISLRLGVRLKQARKAQGLSLESLSKLSGVSVSMISLIERGESNPTVVVTWNLSKALKTDFAGLIEENPRKSGPIKEVIRAGEAPVISAHGKGCTIRILSAPESVGDIEVYELEFKTGGLLESQPHSVGCVEHLTVLDGELVVTSGGATEIVRTGDTIRYKADCVHAIAAKKKAARALLIVEGA